MNYNYCILYAYKKIKYISTVILKEFLKRFHYYFVTCLIIFRDLFIDNQKIKIRFRYLKNICI